MPRRTRSPPGSRAAARARRSSRRWAARLAAFHASAEVCAGGAEPVKRSLDDNFATLHAAGADRALVARLERSAAAFLAAIWDELDARAARGSVRDGHGDLRLEHVLAGAEIAVVDCVEFDSGLRRIDVAADLGFPVDGAPRARPPRPRACAGQRVIATRAAIREAMRCSRSSPRIAPRCARRWRCCARHS